MWLRVWCLIVLNFCGFVYMEWWLVEGMNIIIGGGDLGKFMFFYVLLFLFSLINVV